MKLKIGLVQMNCEKGAITENLERISRSLAKARVLDIDILGFPEMSITGYADPNLYPHAVVRLDGPEVARFLDITRGSSSTVLAGLIEENLGGKPFITQVVARDGQLLGWYRKITIQDEEELWFSAGETIPVFKHNSLIFGIAICADIKNQFVFAECARQGARIVFVLAAPGLYGEQSSRDWNAGFEWWRGECRSYLARYAREYQIWIAVATQAGRTIDEDFPGGGYLFAPNGGCLYETPDGSPGAIFLELDLDHHQVDIIPGDRPSRSG